jgi:phosphofructokinase-like protein
LAKLKRVGILTGGGDCPGLNAVIRAAARTLLGQGVAVTGILDGYHGLVTDRVRPLQDNDLSGLLTLGGTILGSSNKDDPFHFVEQDARGRVRFIDSSDRALATMQHQGLEALLVLGGDGTMTVADKLARKGIKIVGVPKTIDNDLVGTDQTFGHDTAVSVAAEAIDRLHTTADSHHRVIVVEVMGRTAGWLALNSGMASGADVILIPEMPFSLDKAAKVILERKRKGRLSSIVVVAEGATPKGGKQVIARINPLSPEKIRLGGISKVVADALEQRTGIESRSVNLGHIVRGGTPVASDRNLATRYGWAAAQLVLKGRHGVMVALKHGKLGTVPLSAVGGKVRLVSPSEPLVSAALAMGISFAKA